MYRVKTGRGGKSVRTRLRRFLPALLAVVLLVPLQGVNAAGQIASGTIQLSNTLAYGNTAYSVAYSYPSIAQVGTNLTVRVSLHVVALTGLVEYVNQYRLHVSAAVGTQNVLTGDVASDQNSSHLYPGSTWGPFNVTIPLTESNTGLVRGQSANVTMTIALQDQIWYAGNIGVWITEPSMQGTAGSLVIQDGVTTTSTSTGPISGQNYLPYALLALGAVLVLVAVIFTRGSRAPKSNQK
jgi:hypothetical protein